MSKIHWRVGGGIMEDTREYFNVQVEGENADDVWYAIKRMTGVVCISPIEKDE
jgi:hypothetical protein